MTNVTTERAKRPRRLLTPKQDHRRQMSNIRRWCSKHYRERLFTEDGPPRPPAALASEVLRDALAVYSKQSKYTAIDDVVGVSTVCGNDGRTRVLLHNTEEDSTLVVGYNINRRAFVVTSRAAVYRELAIPSPKKTPLPPVTAGPYTDSGQEVESNDEVQPPVGGICWELRRLEGHTTETIGKLDQLLRRINPLPRTPLKLGVVFKTTDGNNVRRSPIGRELSGIRYRIEGINGILDDAINSLDM